MKGRGVAAAAVVSALLCWATLVLWAYSYKAPWALGYATEFRPHEGQSIAGIVSGRGSLVLATFSHVNLSDEEGGFVPPSGVVFDSDWTEDLDDVIWKRGRSFGQVAHNGGRVSFLTLPWWSVVLTFAILPSAVYRQRRKRAAREPTWAASGLCEACGYDLRAMPGRCPECGAVSGDERR